MIKEAIDRVIEMARGTEQSPVLTTSLSHKGADGTEHDFLYRTSVGSSGARQLGDVIKPFRPAKVEVATLTGFVDAVKAGVVAELKKCMVQVEDQLTVSLVSIATDEHGVRDTYLTAKHREQDAFTFDKYYDDPARFTIGVQTAFLQTDESIALLRTVATLKAGSSIQIDDDGFSQRITVKQGEISAADQKVPPRIFLVPIRSFSEIAHVRSQFLLRFKEGGAGQPMPALFNVDGTKWIDETMLAIKHYLSKQDPLKGVPIVS